MVKQRSESGVGREADIHQVTGRVALAKSNLYAVQQDVKNASAMFQKVTDLDPKFLERPPTPGGRFIPGSLCKAIRLALAYHPKMRLAVVDVEETRAQHNVAHATAFPILDFVLRADDEHDAGGQFGPNNSYSGGLELHYNLFNGGADVARQRETAYITQQAAEIRNRTCREVKENMRLSWYAMNTAALRIPTLRTHAEASKETVKAYNQQFKLGKRTLSSFQNL